MFGIFKRSKKTNITISTDIVTSLTDEEEKRIDEKLKTIEEESKQRKIVMKKYKNIIDKYTYITEQLWTKNTYKMVNSQANIFNKYANRYIELCNMYLQILPEYINFDKEMAKIYERDDTFNRCPQDITNMIRLLFKQEKYNEIINVCKYLLSLGITEDGTKKGIKGRIEKAVINFNNKFNTNYIYQVENNLIIDLTTGEIME